MRFKDRSIFAEVFAEEQKCQKIIGLKYLG
jgi:hypothetical protein